MNMKKGNTLRLSIFIIGVIIVVASISVALAYMISRSPEITNSFVPAKMDCEAVTTFNDGTTTSVRVNNNSNIEAYIRVRVVLYWQDSKGNPVARKSPENGFDNDIWQYDKSTWVYDEENQTFYHKAPVDASGSTSELLKIGDGFTGIELQTEKVDYNGTEFTYHPVLQFIVEGIQSDPDTAVKEWGVTLDGNGNITAKANKN